MIDMCDNGDADGVRRNLFNTTITEDIRTEALKTLDELSVEVKERLANYQIIGVEKLLDKDGRPIPLTPEVKRLIEEAEGIRNPEEGESGPSHHHHPHQHHHEEQQPNLMEEEDRNEVC